MQASVDYTILGENAKYSRYKLMYRWTQGEYDKPITYIKLLKNTDTDTSSIILTNWKQRNTLENVQCVRALLRLGLYVINNTDTGIVWPAEMDAITALFKKSSFGSFMSSYIFEEYETWLWYDV